MGEVDDTSSTGLSPEQLESGSLSAGNREKQSKIPIKNVSGSTDPVNEVFETDLTNKQVGRYLVQRKLGSGGTAVVYQAFDQVRGRSVALKVLASTADEKMLLRFRREAMTSGALHHEHIVRTLQVGVAPHGDVAYIAMELVEGESLDTLLSRCRYLDPDEACALLAPIASALAHAHENEIIHRDVKPSNILLQPTRAGNRSSVHIDVLEFPVVPMLSDFGIARSLDSPELTNQGRTVGTPAYMAPEQCAGQRYIDGRADIYSLGAVLFRAIIGHQPFSGTTPQILHAHVYEPLAIDNELLRRLPPQIVEILAISLAKKPDERYQSAGEMAAALADAGGVTLDAALPPAPPTSTATITLDNLVASQEDPSASSFVIVPGVPGKATKADATHSAERDTAGVLPPPRNADVYPGSRSSGDERAGIEPAESINWSGFTLLSIGILVGAVTALIMSGSLGRLTGSFSGSETTTVPTEAASPTETVAPEPSVSNPPGNEQVATTAPDTNVLNGIPPLITPIPTDTATTTPTTVPTSTPSPSPTPRDTPTNVPTSTSAPILIPTPVPTETWTPWPTADPGGGNSTLPPTEAPTETPTPVDTPTEAQTPTPTPELIPPTATWTPSIE